MKRYSERVLGQMKSVADDLYRQSGPFGIFKFIDACKGSKMRSTIVPTTWDGGNVMKAIGYVKVGRMESDPFIRRQMVLYAPKESLEESD